MRRMLAGTGRALITLGILILLFVAYQLWGTGIYTARAQNTLEKQFQAALRASGSAPPSTSSSDGATTATTVPPTTTTAAAPIPPDTDAIARIVIPKIGADYYVVEGVDEADLRKGPGHYPTTPFPGQWGNSAIAGHRTTYGAPFGDVGELEAGDMIRLTTTQGTFDYQVYDKFAVSPDSFEVLDSDPTRLATLTLTTCNPKYSAAQRLIIKAELQIQAGFEPLASTVDPNSSNAARARASGDGLSGDTGSKTPAVLLGLLVALVGGLWWLLFHRHPRWTTWLFGAIPFVIVLSVFYFFFERVLPANY